MSENKSIGGLWKHKTTEGKTYLSGEIEIDSTKHKVVIFKNDYKEQDKHPDYRVYRKMDRDNSDTPL